MGSEIMIGPDRFAGKGDEFYQELMAAHANLTDRQSAVLNARLVLIMANQVGDLDVLRAALKAASATLPDTDPAL
ncbi:MAG: DUF2783 domain-containing protein [Pseudomonadota bacterium]